MPSSRRSLNTILTRRFRAGRGNIGDLIFAPWCDKLRERGVTLQFDTRIEGVEVENDAVKGVKAAGETIPCDDIVFAVGMRALKGLAKSPALASRDEFRKFGNLRGTDVLATRLFFDRDVETPYSANACWGFDDKVGQTWFDLKKLHAPRLDGEPGAVVEVDYYHAGSLLGLSDGEIEAKARRDLETMVPAFKNAELVDAAVVRLPEAVNWYFPGSYASRGAEMNLNLPEPRRWRLVRQFATASFPAGIVSDDDVRVAPERVLRGRCRPRFGPRVLVARKGLRLRHRRGERGSGPSGARRRRAAAAGRAPRRGRRGGGEGAAAGPLVRRGRAEPCVRAVVINVRCELSRGPT